MIERRVPKDIRKYKTKVIGPLTLRQIICVLTAVVVDFILYLIIHNLTNLSIDTMILCLILVDVPIIAFVLSPLNLPMEVYLKEVLIPNFIYPTKRKVKRTVVERKTLKTNDKDKEKREKEVKRLMKEHPEMKPYK